MSNSAIKKELYGLAEDTAKTLSDKIVEGTEAEARPLLHIAVENKDYGLVDLLVKSKISLDMRNANGITALHKAVLAQDIQSIQYLLACGANPNVTDFEGNTALHIAVEKKCSQELIEELMTKGAYYKERNQEGLRPLDLAKNKETQFFMERHHKTLKKMTMTQLTQRIEEVEQKIKPYEEKEKCLNQATKLKLGNKTQVGHQTQALHRKK